MRKDENTPAVAPVEGAPDFPGREIFGTFRASKFLGISPATLKYHLYVANPPNLVPDIRVGEGDRTLLFHRYTLEAFRNRKRKNASATPTPL